MWFLVSPYVFAQKEEVKPLCVHARKPGRERDEEKKEKQKNRKKEKTKKRETEREREREREREWANVSRSTCCN